MIQVIPQRLAAKYVPFSAAGHYTHQPHCVSEMRYLHFDPARKRFPYITPCVLLPDCGGAQSDVV